MSGTETANRFLTPFVLQMSLSEWKDERFIRQVLRQLSRQRVSMILQPGNVWVIECAVTENEGITAALRTCQLRGWAEPIQNAVPTGSLTADGRLPTGEIFTNQKPIYRLTEAGWQVINRTQWWIISTFVVALVTLIATIAAVLIAILARH